MAGRDPLSLHWVYHATKHTPTSPHKKFSTEFRKNIGKRCFSIDEYVTLQVSKHSLGQRLMFWRYIFEACIVPLTFTIVRVNENAFL